MRIVTLQHLASILTTMSMTIATEPCFSDALSDLLAFSLLASRLGPLQWRLPLPEREQGEL